jgi:hypothetical protein
VVLVQVVDDFVLCFRHHCPVSVLAHNIAKPEQMSELPKDLSDKTEECKDSEEVQVVKVIHAVPVPDEDPGGLLFEARMDALCNEYMEEEEAAGKDDRKRAALDSNDAGVRLVQKMFHPGSALSSPLADMFEELDSKMDEPTKSSFKLKMKASSSYGQVEALRVEVVAIKKSLDEVHQKIDDNGKLLVTVAKTLGQLEASLSKK